MGHQHHTADIHQYLDRSFTNQQARSAYEQLFVDSVRNSHLVAPQRWVITHNRDNLSINVGLMHTVMLRQ